MYMSVNAVGTKNLTVCAYLNTSADNCDVLSSTWPDYRTPLEVLLRAVMLIWDQFNFLYKGVG